MSQITKVHARQVLDSRGNPTVEADVFTKDGSLGRAIVPSGASTGKHEAVELRDNDSNKYLGKGVLEAIKNVNSIISPNIIGLNVLDQKKIDNIMIDLDETPNKSNLGANAILAVSLACAKAAANSYNQDMYNYFNTNQIMQLPIPMMNILNGGSHADNSIDFQEFMIMPVSAHSFSEALRMGVEVFHNLKNELKKNGYSTNVGDEGGFAPNLKSNEQAIEVILKSIEKSGYRPGEDIYLSIDAAASEFYNNLEQVYHLKDSTGEKLNSFEMVDYWKELTAKYPIISIEDGLYEDDWDGWNLLTNKIGDRVQLVGDDLFVTNINRFQKGLDQNIANSILIKLNQIGTITETFEVVDLAQRNDYTSIISHRSGESEDTIIADIAVALGTGQIKTGSASRSDRTAKYNQLIRIEEALGKDAIFPGKEFKFL